MDPVIPMERWPRRRGRGESSVFPGRLIFAGLIVLVLVLLTVGVDVYTDWLWFGSLGPGAWWLVFGLVGALREWPGPTGRRPGEQADPIGLGLSALRVARTVVAGGILAWRLGAA